jgi:hypothetical protein
VEIMYVSNTLRVPSNTIACILNHKKCCESNNNRLDRCQEKKRKRREGVDDFFFCRSIGSSIEHIHQHTFVSFFPLDLRFLFFSFLDCVM